MTNVEPDHSYWPHMILHSYIDLVNAVKCIRELTSLCEPSILPRETSRCSCRLDKPQGLSPSVSGSQAAPTPVPPIGLGPMQCASDFLKVLSTMLTKAQLVPFLLVFCASCFFPWLYMQGLFADWEHSAQRLCSHTWHTDLADICCLFACSLNVGIGISQLTVQWRIVKK